MNALDDIQKLLDAMKDRGAEMKTFEGLLGEISAALADIVGFLEKPKAEAKAAERADFSPLVAAIKSLTLSAKMDAPAVTVNVPEQKAPIVNVTMPDKPTKKLKLKVEIERGANGMAKSYAISEV